MAQAALRFLPRTGASTDSGAGDRRNAACFRWASRWPGFVLRTALYEYAPQHGMFLLNSPGAACTQASWADSLALSPPLACNTTFCIAPRLHGYFARLKSLFGGFPRFLNVFGGISEAFPRYFRGISEVFLEVFTRFLEFWRFSEVFGGFWRFSEAFRGFRRFSGIFRGFSEVSGRGFGADIWPIHGSEDLENTSKTPPNTSENLQNGEKCLDQSHAKTLFLAVHKRTLSPSASYFATK